MTSEAEQPEERSSGLSEQMRRELADFLRTRREKLKPENVGLAQTTRRRTPGLRREEVAELAGVGTTWYTWLEQARDIQPSTEVLRRLATALHLDLVEVRHMYALAGKAPPTDLTAVSEIPSPGLLRLLEQAFSVPVILLGARWDVIAVNEQVKNEMPRIAKMVENQSNWIRMVFCDQESRIRLLAWERNARNLIGEFRASLGDLLDNPWVVELIDSLRRDSPEFEKWWKEHDVRDNSPIIFESQDPATGIKRSRERVMLSVMDGSHFKLMAFNPIA